MHTQRGPGLAGRFFLGHGAGVEFEIIPVGSRAVAVVLGTGSCLYRLTSLPLTCSCQIGQVSGMV